jgi:pseudouridine-5'-phosphate glycosidase
LDSAAVTGVHVAEEVARALNRGAPVVALESALITHGFAPPANLSIADRMNAAVRSEGATPAVIAVIGGQVRVGVNRGDVARLAAPGEAVKVSLRDLGIAAARGLTGGTTVAASIHIARRAGIGVFATGGIGGVHRGHAEDVSADLPALGTTPIVVVCSGAKSVLDLPRTLEYLETWAVPIVGYGVDEFPAFFSRDSGIPVDARIEAPEEMAGIARAHRSLGLSSSILVGVPVPEVDAIPFKEAQELIAEAVSAADRQSVGGSALTPYLLKYLVETSGGRTRLANEALLVSNAQVAARIARAIGPSDCGGSVA